MLARVSRLFTIKTKFEAFLVIYGLGAGAVERGIHYLHEYPGLPGRILFAACTVVVFMAGDRILDAVDHAAGDRPRPRGWRRKWRYLEMAPLAG